MRMHHDAGCTALGLDVRDRRPSVQTPRIRDGCHRRGNHLEQREEDQQPRHPRRTEQSHDVRQGTEHSAHDGGDFTED